MQQGQIQTTKVYETRDVSVRWDAGVAKHRGHGYGGRDAKQSKGKGNGREGERGEQDSDPAVWTGMKQINTLVLRGWLLERG